MIVLTWVIAAAGFEHIIAGSVDTLYGLWTGSVTWGGYAHFAIPTLLGNIVGGVGFVAAIATAEVTTEHHAPKRKKSARSG